MTHILDDLYTIACTNLALREAFSTWVNGVELNLGEIKNEMIMMVEMYMQQQSNLMMGKNK